MVKNYLFKIFKIPSELIKALFSDELFSVSEKQNEFLFLIFVENLENMFN